MSFHGFDPGDRNNWYQSPRSNMGEVWFAPDDPYLPPPWKGVIDGNTGRLYYWNLETNITQYEKPAYWVQSSCSPPSFYHSPVTASSNYTCPSQYPNFYPQYQKPAATVINGFKFPQQFPFPNPTNTSTSQPIYPQSKSVVEPIYPNFRSFQPEHDLNPSIPIFQSPPVPSFLPHTQFLNPFPSFGVGSSNAPTTTTAASTPSLDSTPSQPLFGSTPSQSLTSGSNSSPFGPPVSAAISGTTSSSSSQPPIFDVPVPNEVLNSRPAVPAIMDELEKLCQPLSVTVAEEDLTDEDTVDENDEPAPILVDALVDNNEPDGAIYLQSPPPIGGAYWMSLRSVAILESGIQAPLECHPLSVFRIDECLSSLDFVLLVEKNFVLIVEKNENFSSRSPAMNLVNCLETIEDAGELFLKMPERNIVSWKTLISALVLNGQEEKALGVYDTMISEGMVPTHFSLATLFGACEGWLDVEKAIELNVILHNTPLLLCADIGYTDQAIKIFEDVKSSETWKPDSWTFSSMMTIYSCSGKVSEAKRTLNEMMEAGFQLNILILISLIQCYGKAKRTDDVVEAFNQLQQLGITPDERFCGYLLNVMTQTPKNELPKLTDCIERGNEKLGYVVRPLVEKHDSSQNFRKEASELFNSVGSDMKAYCNCFISLRVNLQLWKRACEFLNLGLTREIYTDIQSKYPTQWTLYLKGLSVGAVFTALHVWINDLSRSLESGEEPPTLFGINTANGQTKAISQTRSFSIEVIDFLKVNSVFSSSGYTYGPVVSMITVASQSVVHLIFHAWLLLIHAHKHNIGKRTSLVTLPYFALGTASHVLESLSVIFVIVSTHKKAVVDVICHAAIFYVEFVFFLHMQMVEKLMPSPIVEFPGHSMTRKEIVTFWIWLPTTLLHLQVWVLNLHGLIVIKVQLLIGDIFLNRELMLDIATGLLYFGDDFQWRGASCSQPPEFYRLHYLTTKSDVYSFGVLLLEILSGRKVIDTQYEESRSIVEWAVPLIKAGDIIAILDPVVKLPPDVDALKGIANVACSLPEHCAPSFVCYFDGWCQYPSLLSSRFHCKPSALPTCNPSNSSVDIFYVDQKLDYFALGFTKHSMKSNLSSCKEACLGDCSCLVLFFENNTGNGRMHICVIVVILNVTILVLVGQVSFGFLYYLKKKRLLDYSEEIREKDDFVDSLPGMPIRFSYSTLSTTTTNLSTASQETCGAIEASQVQLFDDSHVGALQRADWLIHKLTTEGHSGYQRNISNHVNKVNMICEDHQGYEASMSYQSYKELLFSLSNKPREDLIDGMIKAMNESGMISAEAFWTFFPMTCLRPEDMPYFKGGGMLGLLFYNYILSWVNVLSYLSGLCFQIGLYLYIADWTRVGSSGKLVCLGMFADRAI